LPAGCCDFRGKFCTDFVLIPREFSMQGNSNFGRRLLTFGAIVLLVFGYAATGSAAADGEDSRQAPPPKRALSQDPPGMKRLSPNYDAWIDPENKRVVVDGAVCLREGPLEMFACLRHTKEHESLVAVDCQAYLVHAGLLAVGAKQGAPAKFQPKYMPATGTEVEITIVWTDSKGAVHRDRAQDWIQDAKTGKAMQSNWVFAGSGFWEDDRTGEKRYLAEQGDFICISNFPSATLDLPVESSQSNDSLLFRAFTDHIPPLGTRVRLVLTPKLDK
jgi:hypothetical protein